MTHAPNRYLVARITSGRPARTRPFFLLIAAASMICSSGVYARSASAKKLDRLADSFVAQSVIYDPTIAYSSGLPTSEHDRFADRTPRALAAWDAKKKAYLKTLETIDPADFNATSRATYAILREQLEADLQMRVCKTELWNVNHLIGWQGAVSGISQQQPIGTDVARKQALKRWRSLPAYIDIEIANLKRGLSNGYLAPKSVVQRVIGQVDSLITVNIEKSPLYSPAERDNDAAFKSAFARILAQEINPALKHYRAYLEQDYLPKARDGVAISDLPSGAACYQATLRYFTTLDRSPLQVFNLGQQTMANNRADVIRIGSKLFGTTDFDAIVARSKDRAENLFQSKEELLNFSRELLGKAKEKTASLINTMPKQDAIIEPMSDMEEAAGITSYYEANADAAKPGIYRIQLGNWETQTIGSAEVTVVHEAWPGHHLQIALAREIVPDTPLSKLSFNSAYVEGWGRYAEALGEEAGIYATEDAKIIRRVWPAHGMVVDPGLHMFGWSRQKAIEFLVTSGMFTAKSADAMVDRIAMIPGQLTSYDSGGLEFKALRTEAELRLGPKFDLAEFHQTILEQGVVPLSELRLHVEAWINTKLASGDQK